MMEECKICLTSKGLSAYLSEADDSMSVIIGRDDDGNLTTKPNLGPSLWILQADVEKLLLLRDVIIYDVHCYLQLAVTRCKVQLAKAECEGRKKHNVLYLFMCYLSLSSIFLSV